MAKLAAPGMANPAAPTGLDTVYSCRPSDGGFMVFLRTWLQAAP